MSDKVEGHLEIGRNDNHEVVINLDCDRTGHIVFSPHQAKYLSELLLKHANEAEAEKLGHAYKPLDIPAEYYIGFDTRIQPGKIVATRVKLDQVTIADMNIPMRIDLCEHPLYRDLQRYVEANRR